MTKFKQIIIDGLRDENAILRDENAILRAKIAELEADRDRAWTHYSECAGTPLMADVMGERDALRARVAEMAGSLAALDRSDAYKRYQDEIAIQAERIAELESFAFYALDHSNDPAIVANAKRVLGK